jgi:hypothetical protein
MKKTKSKKVSAIAVDPVSKGRNLLVRAAKRLVEARLFEAGFTPVEDQTGFTVKDYSNLTLMFGATTPAEKELYDALDLITDVMLGRPVIQSIDFATLADDPSGLGITDNEEMDEVIAMYNKEYGKVGGGQIKNASMIPGYDAKKVMDKMRRTPTSWHLLRSDPTKRLHFVLFGKLYSFGQKKPQTRPNPLGIAAPPSANQAWRVGKIASA